MKALPWLLGATALAFVWCQPRTAAAQTAQPLTSCGSITYTANGEPRPVTQTTDGKMCVNATVSATVSVATITTNAETGGTVTTHGVFQTLLAANVTRQGCTIQNTSADTELLYWGATGSATTTNAFQLAAGQGVNCAVAGISNLGTNIAITSKVTDGATFVKSEQ